MDSLGVQEMKINNMRPFIINAIIAISVVFFCLLSLEIYLRLSPFGLSFTPGGYVSHPLLRYTLRPGFTGKTYGHAFKINSLGFRDYEFKPVKEKGTFRILCIGDSVTFGIGLDLEDTFPKQLERILRSSYPQDKIEVINCGVPSYNTLYEYLFLREIGLKYSPDLAIIGYVYNDSVYHYPITTARYSLFNKAKDSLRRLYLYDFILSRIYKVIYALEGLTSKDPSARAQDLRYAYSDKYFGWQKNKEAFKLLSGLSGDSGIPIVYVIFPKFESMEKGYPYLFLHRTVRDTLKGEPYVLDLLPYFEGRITKDLWVSESDSHPNKEADAIAAKTISDYLSSKNLIRIRR